MTTAAAADFALESPEPGKVPDRVIAELRNLRKRAKEAGTDFKNAVNDQSAKYKVEPGALRAYVVALESDTIAQIAAEAADLERLIG
jgi:hypothetical protein